MTFGDQLLLKRQKSFPLQCQDGQQYPENTTLYKEEGPAKEWGKEEAILEI